VGQLRKPCPRTAHLPGIEAEDVEHFLRRARGEQPAVGDVPEAIFAIRPLARRLYSRKHGYCDGEAPLTAPKLARTIRSLRFGREGISYPLDALSELGITHFDMPASAPRVWAAIRKARR
jgi:hypothetical protein